MITICVIIILTLLGCALVASKKTVEKDQIDVAIVMEAACDYCKYPLLFRSQAGLDTMCEQCKIERRLKGED